MSLLIWILVQWKWEVWSCTRRKCGRNWDECSEITEEEGQRQSETLSQYYIEQEWKWGIVWEGWENGLGERI